MSLTVSSDYPPTDLSAGLASHVLISILAYSFMTIAAVQAGFLAYQNHQLKNGHAGGFLQRFPPLGLWKSFCSNCSGWDSYSFPSGLLPDLYSSMTSGAGTALFTKASFPR